MIALIFELGPLLFQLGMVLAVSIALLAAAGKVKLGYRIYARLGTLAIALLAVWGVLHYREQSVHFDWEQEVRLGAGDAIWIKRQTTFDHFGEAAQIGRAKSLLEEFEFIHPKTGELIQWKGQHDLEPLLLDFDQGSSYLAAKIKPGKHYVWGCPPHPYVFFKFADSGWQRIGIKSFPARFEKSNVFPYLDDPTRKTLDVGGHRMDFDTVERKFRPPMPTEVRSIDRRIVNPLFFCRGSVDQSYGPGVTHRLQERYGTNPSPNVLTEQEAIAFGILRLGDGK